jgi:chemotaxis protein CheD
MAHVFLPEQPEHGSREEAGIGTYADRAIPALVRMVSDTSAVPSSKLVAVVAGGARMFGGRPGTDIGQRNVEAVRRALAAGGIRIVAEDVGGSSGRTMRAIVGSVAGSVAVTVREVASPQRTLWATTRHRESPDRTAA